MLGDTACSPDVGCEPHKACDTIRLAALREALHLQRPTPTEGRRTGLLPPKWIPGGGRRKGRTRERGEH